MAKFEFESKFNIGNTVKTATQTYVVEGVCFEAKSQQGNTISYDCIRYDDDSYMKIRLLENQLTLVEGGVFKPFTNAAALRNWYELSQPATVHTPNANYFITLMTCVHGSDMEIGFNEIGELCCRDKIDKQAKLITLKEVIENMITDNYDVLADIHNARIELVPNITSCDDSHIIHNLVAMNEQYRAWTKYTEVLEEFLEEVSDGEDS